MCDISIPDDILCMTEDDLKECSADKLRKYLIKYFGVEPEDIENANKRMLVKLFKEKREEYKMEREPASEEEKEGREDIIEYYNR